jgi:hypothetical protein
LAMSCLTLRRSVATKWPRCVILLLAMTQLSLTSNPLCLSPPLQKWLPSDWRIALCLLSELGRA